MEMQRAYSILTVKAVSEDKRTIKGIATTPETDRMGDIVESEGAQFSNPAPLLWMHDHALPVGSVVFGKATKEGIPFEATIAAAEEPSQLKARLDEAWQSVKLGLVRAVSIGFRALEWSFMENGGGIHFTKSEILELSLVTVPANAGATIQAVKSIDAAARLTALGQPGTAAKDASKPQPGDKGANPTKAKVASVKINPTSKEDKMNIAEQLKNLQNSRAAKVAQQEKLMQKTIDSGETLSAEENEEFETLQTEVGALDGNIKQLETLQANQMKKATPVTVKANAEDAAGEAAANRGGHARVQLMPATTEKGIAFARLAKCIGLNKGNLDAAAQMAERNYPEDKRISNILKAAVAAGTTTGTTWAAPLVGEESAVFADFVEYLRPQTILGKFGTGNVPALRRVPFDTRLIGQTSGGEGYWVGEGKAKPVTKFDFNNTTLSPLKVANIAVITKELLRRSSPSADAIIRDQLVEALKARLDIDFINPAKAAAAGVSPASITNGVTPIVSSGTDADAIRADLQKLMATYLAANNAPTTGVLIMSSLTALGISQLRNAFGQKEFGGLTMMGGDLDGIPVITSEHVPTDSSGSLMIMVNAQDIWFGDEGGFTVDMSTEASLQMLDNPTNDVTTPTATTLTSLWQTNSVGFLAEREVNWAKRRASAVAYVSGVNYGPQGA